MSRPPLNSKNGRPLDNTGELVAVLVERSAADPNRPQLTAEIEQRLAPVDQKSASCYAHAELLTLKLQRLASYIDNDESDYDDCDNSDEFAPIAPINSDARENNSVVIHLDELRAKTKIE